MSKAKEFLRVPPSSLVMCRNAPRRHDLGDLPALKNALLARGVEKPLGVLKLNDETFSIVSGLGYRRFLALSQLIAEGHGRKFARIPVHVFHELSAIDEPLMLLSSDVHEPLPTETKAAAITQLVDLGLPLTEIASLSGYGLDDLKRILSEGGLFQVPDLCASVFAQAGPCETAQQKLDRLLIALSEHALPQRKTICDQINLISGFLAGRIGPSDAALRMLQVQSECAA